MSSYKTIINKDNILLEKKDNKFKLEASIKVKLPCNIINLTENLEIFNLIKLLNNKIITKCKIITNSNNIDSDIILCFNDNLQNVNSDSSDDLNNLIKIYYITFSINIKKNNDNNIILLGKKNNITINKCNYKKIEIDNILFNIELVNSELNIKLKFINNTKVPIYAENAIGFMFFNFIKKLLVYFSKST